MPYKSDILNNIFADNNELFESIYNKLENKCIESDFDLLQKKDSYTKNDFFDLLLNSLEFKKPKFKHS